MFKIWGALLFSNEQVKEEWKWKKSGWPKECPAAFDGGCFLLHRTCPVGRIALFPFKST